MLKHRISVIRTRSAQKSTEHQGLLRLTPASQKWTTAPVSAFSDQDPLINGNQPNLVNVYFR